MQKNFKLFTPIIVTLITLSIALTITTFFFDHTLFIIASIITSIVLTIVYLMLSSTSRKVGSNLKKIGNAVLYANGEAFADSNVSSLAVYETGEIIWYNNALNEQVLMGKSFLGEHISSFLPDIDAFSSTDSSGKDVEYHGIHYTAYVTLGKRGNENVSVIYLINDNHLKMDSLELTESRPSIALVLVDSYEEMLQAYQDIERAQIMSNIEQTVSQYFTSHNGFIVRLERDRFLVNIEKRGIEAMKENKFEILNQVRNLQVGDRVNATLSIGIGYGAESLAASQEIAQQALDMCLGRGGDQAAIKTDDGYEFYGGVSSGVEKRSKIKTRIIASALSELIETASNVVVMGHKFSDLDCLGSAVGMLSAVRSMGKNAFICIDREKNMVQQLLDMLLKNGYTDADFINPKDAIHHVNNKTLLIVVDAHVPNVLESTELYEKSKHIVVIDHHRKLVDYIKNAVIFYHEPFASSASEMVSELVQYFPVNPEIKKIEAEALLAGITLDTKNFVMRTGVRTFEAAAWLRRRGADTVAVRRMFDSSMDSYIHKANIVSKAESYKNCAIAVCDEQFESIRVVSSQAADDLMNISGTNASFVIFPYEDIVNISARSMGAINVQIIMEQLGGGGHHTMAAVQLKNTAASVAMNSLKSAIDVYYQSLSEEQRQELNIEAIVIADDNIIPDEGTILEGQVLTEMKSSDEI